MESPLRGDTHGGFGERLGETGREQPRHRAPSRLNQDLLGDHDLSLLVGGSFDEFALGEGGAGSDEGDEVRRASGSGLPQ